MSERPREVWIVPVLHDQVELGRLSGRVDPTRASQIDRFWSTLTAAVLGCGLPWPLTDLFVDGLPVCGREDEIVRELARRGSSNHRLVHTLIARGATLHGTESPELLQQELALHTAASPDPDEARRLLVARDRFVAERIVGVLQPGRTALAFVGAAHALDEALAGVDPGLSVRFPFGRPPPAS